jgi:hypothetical protein
MRVKMTISPDYRWELASAFVYASLIAFTLGLVFIIPGTEMSTTAKLIISAVQALVAASKSYDVFTAFFSVQWK